MLTAEAETARNCVRDKNVSLPNNYPRSMCTCDLRNKFFVFIVVVFVDCYEYNKLLLAFAVVGLESVLLLVLSFKKYSISLCYCYCNYFFTPNIILLQIRYSYVQSVCCASRFNSHLLSMFHELKSNEKKTMCALEKQSTNSKHTHAQHKTQYTRTHKHTYLT